jgi:hypothetical protein
MRAGQPGQRVGGWNQPIPPGVVECHCGDRRIAWARLSLMASQGCCDRPCCTAKQSAIMTTALEVHLLRAQAQRERWTCPRCGHPVAIHWRNFQCIDRSVTALRERKRQR